MDKLSIGLGTPFHLARIVKLAREAFRSFAQRPTSAEAQVLVEYARRLDERRAFFVTYNVEVVEACIPSIDQVRAFTDEYLAKLAHPGARAALGAILDATRGFLDRWKSRHTPSHWEMRGGDGQELARFFEDLGELRTVVRLMLSSLRELEPKVSAPNLLPEASDDLDAN